MIVIEDVGSPDMGATNEMAFPHGFLHAHVATKSLQQSLGREDQHKADLMDSSSNIPSPIKILAF